MEGRLGKLLEFLRKPQEREYKFDPELDIPPKPSFRPDGERVLQSMIRETPDIHKFLRDRNTGPYFDVDNFRIRQLN